jgi:hypothetical protein
MASAHSVPLVTDLAARMTRLCDEVGASHLERYTALEIARALVAVSPEAPPSLDLHPRNLSAGGTAAPLVVFAGGLTAASGSPPSPAHTAGPIT